MVVFYSLDILRQKTKFAALNSRGGIAHVYGVDVVSLENIIE